MDRAAIEELFAFRDYGWSEYERAIRPHGDETLTTSAPGSGWPALRDALAHITWRMSVGSRTRWERPMSPWNGLSRGTNSMPTGAASSATPASNSNPSETMS